jgi:diguanylate cyclase (GGDEF)-like protein
MSVTPLGPDHQGVVVTHTDVTSRKEADDKIQLLAFYDNLTGLPNRRLLHDRLHRALAASARSGREGALLFIDLDNFKLLNDVCGHNFGDALLVQVAQRLNGCVRTGDTVARLGGDEFVVLLENLHEKPEEAAATTKLVGEKILALLHRPYQLADQQHLASASIGATMFLGHRDSIDELLKRADIAMYQAKTAGRHTIRFYDQHLQSVVATRVTLEADLRAGIAMGQLVLYFQPQMDGLGGITGAEALVRWRHPERGLVSPAEFIPIAEETGLILPLGNWVLDAACRQIAAWSGRRELAHLTVAVNVSARQFQQEDFVGAVLEVLAATCADPHKLKLELTESMLCENVEGIIIKMESLKKCGIRFSLDDFGTGYSSLSYLKRLPLSQLKIDQSFVRDVTSDANDAAIARTIISLGRTLGLEVIAEGVETEGQRAFLADLGCHAFQGYLFGRPEPADAFERSHVTPGKRHNSAEI